MKKDKWIPNKQQANIQNVQNRSKMGAFFVAAVLTSVVAMLPGVIIGNIFKNAFWTCIFSITLPLWLYIIYDEFPKRIFYGYREGMTLIPLLMYGFTSRGLIKKNLGTTMKRPWELKHYQEQYKFRWKKRKKTSAFLVATVLTSTASLFPGLVVGLCFQAVFWVCILFISLPALFYILRDMVPKRLYFGYLNGMPVWTLLKYGFCNIEFRDPDFLHMDEEQWMQLLRNRQMPHD